MRVGAVVCVYRSALIRRQLESMVDQTRPLDEIVIVDDSGSSDWTADIEAGLEGFRGDVVFVTNVTNLGMRRSYELAFDRSSADVVLVADHDDEWWPRKVEVVARTMEDPARSGCFHDMDVYETSGHRVADGVYLGRFFDVYPGRADPELTFAALLEKPVASGACLALRRSVIPEAMRIPDTVFPDYFLQLLVARAGTFDRIDEQLVNYRRHADNATPLPSRWHRFEHRTPDPAPLVAALLGGSEAADRALRDFGGRVALRRSVERGEGIAWFRASAGRVGLRATANELLRTYRRPTRLALDLARRAHSLVRRR